jgi:pimeloyl-ACP methyl ester carboxylesterase
VRDYVRFTEGFLRKLNIAPQIMVGHSLGGRVLLKGVGGGQLSPERLVLIASAGIAKTATARNRAYAAVAKLGKVLTAVPPLRGLRAGLRRRLYQRAGSDYLTSGPLKDTFLNVVREDLSTSAAAIRAPTMLIWGDTDDQTPVSDGRRLMGLISGSKLRLITGVGHFVHHEKPNEVWALVKEFLA